MSPDRTQLRAGVASIAITPPTGVLMQGYEPRYATGIDEPLSVSALAVGGHHAEWILLSVDCIGVDRDFTARIRQTITRRLGLPTCAITVACSHTHSGPATLPKLGPVPCDDAYLAALEERLISAAAGAAEDLQPARWCFGVTSLAENVNRRLPRRGRIELAANSKGRVDSRLRVIRVDRAGSGWNESPLALIVHYACHATASGGIPRISSDWPGVMRRNLEHIYSENGTQPVVCFLQGCAGDVTHRVGRDPKSWPVHFGKSTSTQAHIVGRLVSAAAVSASERSVELPTHGVRVATHALDLSFHEGAGSETTEVQIVRVSRVAGSAAGDADALWLIGLPGEPVTSYSLDLGAKFARRVGAQPDRVLVCGYTNDCVGYLCAPRDLRKGGYESAAAHRNYHRPSAFSSATEKRVLDAVLAAARSVRGKAPSPKRPLVAAGLTLLGRWRSRASRLSNEGNVR